MAKPEIDFFTHSGYRLLAVDMLILAINDANQHGDSRARQEAIDWFNYQHDSSKPVEKRGLRYQDCLDALGSARTKDFRDRALAGDKQLLAQLKTIKTQWREIRDDPTEVSPARQTRAGGVLEVFTRGSLNVGRPQHASIPDGLRGAM